MLVNQHNNKRQSFPTFSVFLGFKSVSALMCLFIRAEGFNIQVQPRRRRNGSQDAVSGDRLSVLLQSSLWRPL